MPGSVAPSTEASVPLAPCGLCRKICRATEKATHSNAQKLIAKATNKSRIENDRAQEQIEA
jgi:hypothetical protein